MEIADQRISSCRHCQFYVLEGRRGGHCKRLGTLVQGNWSACSLGISPFTSDWKKLASNLPWQSALHPQELLSPEGLESSSEPMLAQVVSPETTI